MSARSRAVHGRSSSVSFVSPRPRRRRCSRACVSVPGKAEHAARSPSGRRRCRSAGLPETVREADSYRINAILCESGAAGRTVRHLTPSFTTNTQTLVRLPLDTDTTDDHHDHQTAPVLSRLTSVHCVGLREAGLSAVKCWVSVVAPSRLMLTLAPPPREAAVTPSESTVAPLSSRAHGL